MAYYRLPEKELRAYCEAVMGKYGFNEKQSRDIADILLTADLQGLESHGVQRLIRYHRGVKSGVIRPDAVPEVVHETPLSVVLDAHSAMGQIAAVDAMERAIAKAKQYGFGAAVVMMTILPYFFTMAVAPSVSTSICLGLTVTLAWKLRKSIDLKLTLPPTLLYAAASVTAIRFIGSMDLRVMTMVFDEVDTGVSGRAAQRVAEKLAKLSRTRQVLCVTHLPQLAAMADTHFGVEKGEENGRTLTKVVALDRAARRGEIARLSGGDHPSETMLLGAEELLCAAENFKNQLL